MLDCGLSLLTMKSRWPILLTLILAGAAGAHFLKRPAATAKPADGKKPAVPVVAAAVKAEDVPIWLTGLGTVQAFNTVTLRPRVSGALEKMAFTEGQDVKAGDLLARIDPRPYQSALDQAEAKQAQAAAQLASARNDLNRASQLVGSGAESRGKFDELKATSDRFTALEQESRAAAAAAKLDLEFTEVRAPISGRTGVRLVDEGNLVTANQTGGLVVITQLEPIAVMVSLPQENLTALQTRMKANPAPVVIQVVGDDEKVLAEGKLEMIDNQIDTTTGAIRLKASFDNKDHVLWPGQFVSARVLVDTRMQAVVVPTEVIQAGLDAPFAYVIKTDQTVEPRNLRPGPRSGAVTIIEEGLRAGEQVVTDGQSKLQPGASVVIQPATL